MELRNLPTGAAAPLASLVTCHAGQVSSMSLLRGGLEAGLSATLFAFAAGESVSEERYGGDTLYLCVEGSMAVTWPDGRRAALVAGDVLRVPAGEGARRRGSGRAIQDAAGHGACELAPRRVREPWDGTREARAAARKTPTRRHRRLREDHP